MKVILNNRLYLFARSDNRSLLQLDTDDKEALIHALMANCTIKIQSKSDTSTVADHRDSGTNGANPGHLS